MGGADRPTSGWRCPECGRRFLRRTREHSCHVTSVEAHLERTSPEVRGAFEALEAALKKIGPHDVVPLKTMITLSGASTFAGLIFTRSRVDLGFFLVRPLRSDRIRRIERLSPTKIAHHVHLSSASDVDAELIGWLREAYAIGASGGRST